MERPDENREKADSFPYTVRRKYTITFYSFLAAHSRRLSAYFSFPVSVKKGPVYRGLWYRFHAYVELKNNASRKIHNGGPGNVGIVVAARRLGQKTALDEEVDARSGGYLELHAQVERKALCVIKTALVNH